MKNNSHSRTLAVHVLKFRILLFVLAFDYLNRFCGGGRRNIESKVIDGRSFLLPNYLLQNDNMYAENSIQ